LGMHAEISLVCPHITAFRAPRMQSKRRFFVGRTRTNPCAMPPIWGAPWVMFESMWDLFLTNCHAATMTGAEPYGAVRDAAIGVAGGRIAWVGPRPNAPGRARETRDLGGAWVTPGLIDCHTHLVFGGNRAGEWEARLKGASYGDLAKKGGGIVSTVKATRAASEDELVASAQTRLDAMTRKGVTTVEIKSGYGLDLETEKKMLRAAGRLKGARLVRTFLGAHALPPEFAHDRKAYVDLVCDEMIPAVAGEHLADAVDAFCETIGFNRDETERVFKAAAAHGLKVKLHAEQLSDQGGAELAHDRRGVDAVAGDVADGDADLSSAEFECVVPVTAHL